MESPLAQARLPDQHCGFGLARYDEQRDRVGPSAQNSCDRIGSSRTRGDESHTQVACHSGVALSRHRAGLLMMVAYELELGMTSERLYEEHATAPGDHEDVADALLVDALNYVFRYRHEIWAGVVGVAALPRKISSVDWQNDSMQVVRCFGCQKYCSTLNVGGLAPSPRGYPLENVRLSIRVPDKSRG